MSNQPVAPEILFKRLQALDFLKGLDVTSLTFLAESATWKVFAPNSVVFWEGEINPYIYYLQYGSLKALKSSPNGREQVLRFINAGEVFNELGVLAQRPSPATVVTLEESGIWLIPRSALEGIVLTHPAVAMQIIENMADKITELATLAADLSLKTVEARLAKILLEQAEGDVIERRRWSSQAELAARLGTVPDVLGRVFRELTKAGLLKMDRQRIQILNRQELEARSKRQDE